MTAPARARAGAVVGAGLRAILLAATDTSLPPRMNTSANVNESTKESLSAIVNADRCRGLPVSVGTDACACDCDWAFLCSGANGS